MTCISCKCKDLKDEDFFRMIKYLSKSPNKETLICDQCYDKMIEYEEKYGELKEVFVKFSGKIWNGKKDENPK